MPSRATLPAQAAIVALAAAAALAAPAAQTGQAGQQPVFKSRTEGVLVDVLVTERNRPVAGLTAADFELRDNNVVQTIDAAEISDAPLNAVLALDMSGSTEGQRLSDLRSATAAFVGGLQPRDRIALTTFTHAVASRVPLTEALGDVTAALDRLAPEGETAILDGVHVALMTTQAEPGRSLVLVFTDGRDTMSWLQPNEVLDSARRSNAVIYAVATGGARQWPALSDLADATGGRTIEIETRGDLERQFERILLEFRSRYVLTYTPRGVENSGFHRLNVRVKRGGMSVRARPGYVAGGERP
jgi:Ca-activated chloride channel family protein